MVADYGMDPLMGYSLDKTTCSTMFIETLFIIARSWKEPQKLRIPKIQFSKHKKIKKKEGQHFDTSFLHRSGNKILIEGVTETKFGAETKDGP